MYFLFAFEARQVPACRNKTLGMFTKKQSVLQKAAALTFHKCIFRPYSMTAFETYLTVTYGSCLSWNRSSSIAMAFFVVCRSFVSLQFHCYENELRFQHYRLLDSDSLWRPGGGAVLQFHLPVSYPWAWDSVAIQTRLLATP